MFLLPKSALTIKTVHKKGRGVFANTEIEPGTVIGDYIGKVVGTDDEDEEKYGLYYMWYNNKSSILGDSKEAGIHTINHSCMPNCAMYSTKENHTLYYALRRIFKGEELTVSYELGFCDENCHPDRHGCHCGSPICSGTMHSYDEDWDKKTNDEEEEGEFQPIGTTLQLLKKYPKKIRIASTEKIFGSIKKSPMLYNDVTLPLHKEIRKRIEDTGRILFFQKLNIKIYGIWNHTIIGK